VCQYETPKPSRTEPFERLGELFAGRQFDGEIIVLCVCWYLSFKLSLRDLVGSGNVLPSRSPALN